MMRYSCNPKASTVHGGYKGERFQGGKITLPPDFAYQTNREKGLLVSLKIEDASSPPLTLLESQAWACHGQNLTMVDGHLADLQGLHFFATVDDSVPNRKKIRASAWLACTADSFQSS